MKTNSDMKNMKNGNPGGLMEGPRGVGPGGVGGNPNHHQEIPGTPPRRPRDSQEVPMMP